MMSGKYRRNNYQHKISAKIGTHALTVIYVDRKTSVAKFDGRLKPGDRIKWRYTDSVWSDVITGIVADESKPNGPLFITLQ
jgi:hypothetical protein